MNQKEISFGIPEIFSTRRVKLRIPEIKVRTTKQAQETVKAGSNQIEESAKALAAAQRSEILTLSMSRLTQQRAFIESEHKKAVADITSAIDQAKKAGANPAQLTSDSGETINLTELLDSTNKQFTDGIAQMDAAIASVQKELSPP